MRFSDIDRVNGAVGVLVAVAFLSSSLLVPVRVAAAPSPVPQASNPFSSFSPRGPAPQTLEATVTLAIPLRNQLQLDSLVAQVSDPTSPMYRHFLTSPEIRSEFLPVAAYESLMRTVNASGLKVVMTALDSVVVVQGTAQQISKAFGTGIDLYSNGTSTFYATSGGSTFDGAYVYATNATYIFARPALATFGGPSGNVTFTASSITANGLQAVYNATSLYSDGFTGVGQTIGILDYYGSPTVGSDLAKFDSEFGFANSTFKILPVGPYDPNLGVSVGWSTEVALDAEVSHAMAPGAAVDMYVANGALSLAAPLAQIVQDDKVTTLSQSFGTPEWYYSQTRYLGGPAWFAENALIPDQYYALGSVEGISFMASTGDAGGGGYSVGPEGGVEYPASSPFVTAVGGSQTYGVRTAGGSESFVQTVWSNIGYVPNEVNAGGGGGGVSILEPKPWYQGSQKTPATYPDGRLNPDLSLQAGGDPSTLIVAAGKQLGIGGTSESSPLLAGLLSLVAEAGGGPVGLVNPFLYQVGNNQSEYGRGFNPLTRGYIVPWTASNGYNLAGGWGTPNVGELTQMILSYSSKPQLSIDGEISNSTGGGQTEFTAGQTVALQLRISEANSLVTTGSFTAYLQSLTATTSPVPLSYDSKTGNWTGSVSVGAQSGLTYVFASGSSGGVSGEAFGIIFTGYLSTITQAAFPYLLPTDPWTWGPGDPLPVVSYSSTLDGTPAPDNSTSMAVESYSIGTNSYQLSGTLSLEKTTAGAYAGNLTVGSTPGPATFIMGGDTYGYAPIANGIYLQTSYIYPEVAAEPGSVAPGQSLTIIADPIAPVNAYFDQAYEYNGVLGAAVSVGANVTASLVGPDGTVSKATLTYQPCAQALRVCNGGASTLYGQLRVPADATPGLYTVALYATFGTDTVSFPLEGSFYGQIMVSQGLSTPKVTLSPSTLYEGQSATITADIAYPNGTEVRFGEYSAVVYPSELAPQYTAVMHAAYAGGGLTALSFDPSLDRWTGTFNLPSSTGPGDVSTLSGEPVPQSGPFDAFVTGLSFDGVPTTGNVTAEHGFFVQPYRLTSGPVTGAQTSGLAFEGATIGSPGYFSGDVFLGSDRVEGAGVTIAYSSVNGTLTVSNSDLTLVGLSGGSIVASGSHIRLVDSDVASLSLTNSTLSVSSSSYGSISPFAPTVMILSPTDGSTFSGVTLNATVRGDQVSSVVFSLDGRVVGRFGGGQGGGFSVPVSASNFTDGEHTFQVSALQSDNITTSSSVSFATDFQEQAQLKSQSQAIDSLRFQQELLTLGVASVAIAALVIAIYATRGRPAPPTPAQAGTQTQPSQNPQLV